MKSAVLSLVLVLGASSAFAAHDHADHSATTQPTTRPTNTVCPVSKEPIDPTITTVYQGQTIAFCCEDCIADFKKNPEKYLKNLK